MEAMELIKGRKSVRRYKDEFVSKEDMEAIIEVARYAPSWANTQVARYTMIQDPEVIKKICDNGVNGFTYNMKVLCHAKNAVVLSFVNGQSGRFGEGSDFATSKHGDWEIFDAGIACQTFCLAAHAQGIGTCIMGVIDADTIADAINLPENETVAALITLGYPNETPKATPRKEVNEILRW